MAGITEQEYNDTLNSMIYQGAKIKLGVKAKLRHIYKAGRYLSGVSDVIPCPVAVGVFGPSADHQC